MRITFQGKNGPTLDSTAKIKSTEWQIRPPRPWKAGGPPLAKRPQDGITMSEAEVVFRKGEFVSGMTSFMLF